MLGSKYLAYKRPFSPGTNTRTKPVESTMAPGAPVANVVGGVPWSIQTQSPNGAAYLSYKCPFSPFTNTRTKSVASTVVLGLEFNRTWATAADEPQTNNQHPIKYCFIGFNPVDPSI
jgi:hypothetical protein